MHLIPSFTLEGFYLGPVYVYVWGLTAAIGVLAAVLMAEKKVVSKNTLKNKFWNLAILLILAVFLGARIFYILETSNYYLAYPLAILKLWEGGFSFFGGVVGGVLAGWLWAKKNKIDFLILGWVFTPAWLFGLFFGRVGCFLIHDHLGKPADWPWSVFVSGAYRHEPALYEALWVLIVGIVMLFLDDKYNGSCHPERAQRIEGSLLFFRILFPLSLFLYSLGRFLFDFFRANDPRYYNLTIAQWLCIIMTIGCLVAVTRTKNRKL
jgi:phosphatidylglycerol:prolipoprotein diacylglycerol transferase